MRKKIIITLLGFILFVPIATSAINLGFSGATQKAAQAAGYGSEEPATIVGIVVVIALSLMGVLFLAFMVYAGYLWMTARGEDEPIKKAQKIITAAIIGVLIVASAYSVVYFIIPLIYGKTTGEKGGTGGYESGDPKINCCSFCGDWDFTCPPAKQVGEEECKKLGGKYLGLMPANQCK